MKPPVVTRAGRDRLDDLHVLFDAYRVFYGQPSDRVGARSFLSDRFRMNDSVLLIADTEGAAVGFTQLYPSYSSVAMKPVWVLNDLYVSPEARRAGVGRELLTAAAGHANETGALRLSLATARDNRAAKSLYERAGWVLDSQFDHYQLAVATE